MPPDTAPRVETHLVPDEPLDVAQQSPATDVVALASDLGSFPCSARVSLHTPPAARLMWDGGRTSLYHNLCYNYCERPWSSTRQTWDSGFLDTFQISQRV